MGRLLRHGLRLDPTCPPSCAELEVGAVYRLRWAARGRRSAPSAGLGRLSNSVEGGRPEPLRLHCASHSSPLPPRADEGSTVRAMRLIPVLAAAVLLAGCTSTSSAPPSVTSPSTSQPASAAAVPATGYKSAVDLRDAVTAAGYPCEAWSLTNDVETAVESGRCSDSDSFAIFKSISEVRAMSAGYTAGVAKGDLDGTSALFGTNWVLLLPTDDIDKIESAMGGIRQDPPTTEDGTAGGRSAAETAFLKAEDPDDEDYALEAGHESCGSLKDYKSKASQAFYMLDADASLDDFRNATKFLCPKYWPALKLAARGFTDGEYEVALKTTEDKIKAGSYRTEKGVRDCYWERMTKHGSTITNNFISYAPGGARVTIRSSDGGFKSDGCGSWLPAS